MKELLKLSLSTFKKNMGSLLLVTLVYYIIMYAFQMIVSIVTQFTLVFSMAGADYYGEEFMIDGFPFIFVGITLLLSIVSILVTNPIVFGLQKVFLDVTDNIKAKAGNIFYGFKIYGKVIGVTFLTILYTFLWSLLFIIPGIIAGFKYILAPLILVEDPTLSPNEAISLSKEYMKGQKGNLFGYTLIAYFAFLIVYLIGAGLVFGAAFGAQSTPILGGVLMAILGLNFFTTIIVIIFISIPIALLFLVYFYKRAKRIFEEKNAINLENI